LFESELDIELLLKLRFTIICLRLSFCYIWRWFVREWTWHWKPVAVESCERAAAAAVIQSLQHSDTVRRQCHRSRSRGNVSADQWSRDITEVSELIVANL